VEGNRQLSERMEQKIVATLARIWVADVPSHGHHPGPNPGCIAQPRGCDEEPAGLVQTKPAVLFFLADKKPRNVLP